MSGGFGLLGVKPHDVLPLQGLAEMILELIKDHVSANARGWKPRSIYFKSNLHLQYPKKLKPLEITSAIC